MRSLTWRSSPMNEEDTSFRLGALEERLYNFEDEVRRRLDDLETTANTLSDVCGAVADDTLRLWFLLDEMSREGILPTLPLDVATGLVELQHAMRAAKDSKVDDDGVAAGQRVEELKAHVSSLRESYRKFVGGS